LKCLRSLNVRHNKLKSSGIPAELFKLEDLTTLDLSHNRLKEVPEGLEKAKSLLNRKHPTHTVCPTDRSTAVTVPTKPGDPPHAKHATNSRQPADLSGHVIKPMQLPSLQSLVTLHMRNTQRTVANLPTSLDTLSNLSDVDLQLPSLQSLVTLHMRNTQRTVANLPTSLDTLSNLCNVDLQLPSLQSLVTLHMRNTQRTVANLPTSLDTLSNLSDVDLQLPSLQSLVTLHMRNTQRTVANLPTSLDTLSNLCDVNLCSYYKHETNSRDFPWTRYQTYVMWTCVNLTQQAVTINTQRTDATSPGHVIKPMQLPSLQSLVTLHMRNTQRTVANLPTSLDTLSNLSDVDLSKNALTKKLECLNLSRNNLTSLPASLCKLPNLRRLHVDDNKLDFEGIPSGIGKLGTLEVFSAANNSLEMIPEGLCSDLESLQLHGNPDLVMPPKPVERARGSGLQYYNIDFSLQAQLQLAGANTSEPTTPTSDLQLLGNPDLVMPPKPVERARGSGFQYYNIDFSLQAQLQLAGANTSEPTTPTICDFIPPEQYKCFRPKRWDESLEKPPLDYSEFFDEDTGRTPGMQVWEIENFIPAPVDELDKGACAAMHAVNLRNLLGARRTQRHEQGDETPEFLALFPIPPVYIQGSHTPSGFFTHYVTRLYRVHGAGNSIHLEPVPVHAHSLDPRYVFVLDTGLIIYLWNGKKAKNTLKSKARLCAEKINKEERKNKAELIAEPPGKEPRAFWEILQYQGENPFIPEEHVNEEFIINPARLYRVELGMGYLELPQPDGAPLARSVLATRNVYVLDAHVDVFVWFGKKSSRLVRAAAVKLAQELFNMVSRPPHALVTRLQEGTETQVFKTYFLGWEEIIAVDFTRTAESVARTGADLAGWARQQETNGRSQNPRGRVERRPGGDGGVRAGRQTLRAPARERAGRVPQLRLLRVPVQIRAARSRRAPNMGWLTFTFGLERKFKQLCKRLDVVRTHQQQESLNYILNVPLEGANEESSAIVYVWIGANSDSESARLIEQLAEEKFNNPWVSLQPYDTEADYLNYTRLFRCSNEKGYFTVSEKCTDFCQDDLADDDIMILDNGDQVFLWLGAKCSEVYIQHMNTMQPDKQRKLFLTLKNKESRRFTKCFHGWGEHKRPPE
ncbi:Protein flightless-1, partial [Operophtera brumata]